jgi:hypothetical protein
LEPYVYIVEFFRGRGETAFHLAALRNAFPDFRTGGIGAKLRHCDHLSPPVRIGLLDRHFPVGRLRALLAHFLEHGKSLTATLHAFVNCREFPLSIEYIIVLLAVLFEKIVEFCVGILFVGKHPAHLHRLYRRLSALNRNENA